MPKTVTEHIYDFVAAHGGGVADESNDEFIAVTLSIADGERICMFYPGEDTIRVHVVLDSCPDDLESFEERVLQTQGEADDLSRLVGFFEDHVMYASEIILSDGAEQALLEAWLRITDRRVKKLDDLIEDANAGEVEYKEFYPTVSTAYH